MVAPAFAKRLAWRLPRMLLAAFALLLGATHCVEIDDRDLEADDGGGDAACQRGADDSTCTVCLKQNCCTQLANCVASSDCVNFSDCIYDCGTTDECITLCAGEYPDGTDPFIDLLYCNVDLCPTECGG